ncbi:MAG: lipoyl(octanoyl) transferase LipB [Nitrospirales bacterium]
MTDRIQTPEPGQVLATGFLPFAEAWDLQKTLVGDRKQDRIPDTLILTQHEPVLTFGRTAKPEHWEDSKAVLEEKGITLFHLERGGSVTYHGPGQLVGYPILRLRTFCPGPRLYVYQLEEVLIRTLAAWDIHACRHDTHRGVWVEGPEQSLEKIASIGVRIDRGITMHGFALNVNVDLWPFTLITPCGIDGVYVTSMAEVLSRSVDVEAVQETIIQKFSNVFSLPFSPNCLL